MFFYLSLNTIGGGKNLPLVIHGAISFLSICAEHMLDAGVLYGVVYCIDDPFWVLRGIVIVISSSILSSQVVSSELPYL